jgi:calcium homeostasis endoplasmic reticulum protein
LPPPNFPVPDLSRPPPGFSTPDDGQGSFSLLEQQEMQAPIVEDLTPSLPYFELPAGLMVPLIRLEDYNYHALDPELIRLPPPTPPSERLISAVEAFYSLPCHDRPRDG